MEQEQKIDPQQAAYITSAHKRQARMQEEISYIRKKNYKKCSKYLKTTDWMFNLQSGKNVSSYLSPYL
jgi:hypothetical protein